MEAPKQRVRGTITPERMLKMEQEKIIEDKKKKSENNKKYLANKKKKERLKKRDPELYNELYPDMSVYEDGRTPAMIGLDYSLIAEELGCGDPARTNYKAIAAKFNVSFHVLYKFCHLPAYKQITDGLTKLKGEMWVDVAWQVLQDVPLDNAQAKNQENKMKHAQWMAGRLHPERYGNKTETVVKHELSPEERALKIAKLADMMRKKDEDKRQLRNGR